MGILSGIFSGGIKGLADGASDLIGKFVEDPTKKAELTQQLAQLQSDQLTKMAELSEQQYEAGLKDNDSARQMQIAALKQDSWFAKNQIHILSIVITLGFFGLLTYMVKFDVPPANKDMLNIMLGSLGAAWLQVVSFYFGSSKSSQAKDDTINKLSS